MIKRILYLLYTLIAVLFLISAIEVALHVADRHTPQFVRYEFYNNLLGDLSPDISMVDNISKIKYKVTTNSQGIRSLYPTSKTKEPNTFRVICLGDSFTYGVCVDDMETYPYLLESFLKSKYPGKKIEVINLGVPFFDIVDELDQWIEKAHFLQPDVVIVQFFNNDVQTMNGYSFRRSRRAEKGEYNKFIHILKNTKIFSLAAQASFKIRTFTGNSYTTSEHSKDHWYDGRYCIDLSPEQIKILASGVIDQNNIDKIKCRWDKYFDNLLELKKAVEDAGAKFIFINIPDQKEITENYFGPSKYLNERLNEHKISYIDFLDLFRTVYHRERIALYNTPLDFHTNKIGNTLIAKSISDSIEISENMTSTIKPPLNLTTRIYLNTSYIMTKALPGSLIAQNPSSSILSKATTKYTIKLLRQRTTLI